MPRPTPMDLAAARRITNATADPGFAVRAQAAAWRNAWGLGEVGHQGKDGGGASGKGGSSGGSGKNGGKKGGDGNKNGGGGDKKSSRAVKAGSGVKKGVDGGKKK